MGVNALSYMNLVVSTLTQKYNLSENDALGAVKKSYLYESLINDPTETMHDSINISANNVFCEIYG